jgi:hypothetical protein
LARFLIVKWNTIFKSENGLLGVLFDVKSESGVRFHLGPLIRAQKKSQKNQLLRKFFKLFLQNGQTQLPRGLEAVRPTGPEGASQRLLDFYS